MKQPIDIPRSDHFDLLLRKRWENGWDFNSGDPEYWKFSEHLLVPGGKLLDIGVGEGSSSLYFALNGMEVTGIDSNPQRVANVNQMSAELKESMPDFRLKAIESDVFIDQLPAGEFDTAIIAYMIHMPSLQAAHELFDKALAAIKPGGHIYVRVAGKHSGEYQSMAESGGFSQVFGPSEMSDDGNVIWHECGCSGEMTYEPSLYFDPLHLHAYFSERNSRLIHSQTIGTPYGMNIMYGDNFNPGIEVYDGGMITAIAQKA